MSMWARLALLAILCTPLAAQGSGMQSLEQGTQAIGRAMVGAETEADSASTAFYNPAGMARLEKPELETGLMLILGDAKFNADGGNTTTGSNGGNQADDAIAPGGMFYVHPLDERWSVGLNFAAPFVGSLDPDEGWVGRYSMTSLDLAVYSAGPAVAYKLTDKLSLGVQGFVNYADMDMKVAINTAGADGQAKIKDADDWQTSWGAGLLWEPIDGTRLGVAYKSEMDLNSLDGDLRLTVPIAAFSSGIKLGFNLPQNLVAGVRQQLGERWTLYGSVLWADFSEFDLIEVDISAAGSVTANSHFRDTIGYGVGADYRLNDRWTLRSGISYASSPISGSHRIVVLPFDRQVRYGAGFTWAWRPDVDLSFSYEYLDLGDASINQQLANPALIISGDYPSNAVQFVALSIRKRF